jgi:hypothetical protein
MGRVIEDGEAAECPIRWVTGTPRVAPAGRRAGAEVARVARVRAAGDLQPDAVPLPQAAEGAIRGRAVVVA